MAKRITTHMVRAMYKNDKIEANVDKDFWKHNFARVSLDVFFAFVSSHLSPPFLSRIGIFFAQIHRIF